MSAEPLEKPRKSGACFLAWATAVAGWLLCAVFCLVLTIELEAWPRAYDMFFPAVLLILFCNILVFLFICSRWGAQIGKLAGAVARVCLGEAIILAGFYALGRFCMGA